MKRYLLTLLTSLLLSVSLFSMELTTSTDTRSDVALEILVESTCESESSSQQVVWDDLYTKIEIDFAELCKKVSSTESHFNFYDVTKDIFRPPRLV